MKVYEHRTRVRLPRPRPEVFAFFADAANLQAITPPWLHFRILTPGVELKEGALIDYRLRLHGFPLRWRTEITAWDPPARFVDEQIRGPYRLWVHEHTFEEDGDGTIMTDYVRYAVPFGALANWLLVARDVRAIFEYREARLREQSTASRLSRAIPRTSTSPAISSLAKETVSSSTSFSPPTFQGRM